MTDHRFLPSGQTPFQTPGLRFALATCPSSTADLGRVVTFAVADPKGHPFDLGPLATLDEQQVRELWKTLGTWLGEST